LSGRTKEAVLVGPVFRFVEKVDRGRAIRVE
jgi:hypothetical protein